MKSKWKTHSISYSTQDSNWETGGLMQLLVYYVMCLCRNDCKWARHLHCDIREFCK